MRPLCTIALFLLPAWSAAADDAAAPVVIPGGVADAAGKVGYLTQPKGGLAAVDLEKGTVLWESKEATRPLAVVGKRLAALAADKGLRIVLLDTEAKGKKLAESEPIKLPEWVVIGTGLDHQQAGKSFTARASVAKGEVVLHWSAGSRYFGGAAPSEEILKQATKDASGQATVNVETGKTNQKMDAKTQAVAAVGFGDVEKLPKEVQEVAKREGWQAGKIVGPRAFGVVQKSQGRAGGFGMLQVFLVQAVDLKTGRLLWERAYEEQRVLPPPP